MGDWPSSLIVARPSSAFLLRWERKHERLIWNRGLVTQERGRDGYKRARGKEEQDLMRKILCGVPQTRSKGIAATKAGHPAPEGETPQTGSYFSSLK